MYGKHILTGKAGMDAAGVEWWQVALVVGVTGKGGARSRQALQLLGWSGC